jgi:hypothetical protein
MEVIFGGSMEMKRPVILMLIALNLCSFGLSTFKSCLVLAHDQTEQKSLLPTSPSPEVENLNFATDLKDELEDVRNQIKSRKTREELFELLRTEKEIFQIALARAQTKLAEAQMKQAEIETKKAEIDMTKSKAETEQIYAKQSYIQKFLKLSILKQALIISAILAASGLMVWDIVNGGALFSRVVYEVTKCYQTIITSYGLSVAAGIGAGTFTGMAQSASELVVHGDALSSVSYTSAAVDMVWNTIKPFVSTLASYWPYMI